MSRLPILSLVALLLAARVPAADTPSAELIAALAASAAPAAAPPTIDGDLSDACWQAATAVRSFSLAGRPSPAPETTAVRALFDAAHLYLAVECAEPAMQRVKAAARPRDGGAWEADCVEVFLRPGNDPGDYYQLVVNAAGAIDDYHVNPAAPAPLPGHPRWIGVPAALPRLGPPAGHNCVPAAAVFSPPPSPYPVSPAASPCT